MAVAKLPFYLKMFGSDTLYILQGLVNSYTAQEYRNALPIDFFVAKQCYSAFLQYDYCKV